MNSPHPHWLLRSLTRKDFPLIVLLVQREYVLPGRHTSFCHQPCALLPYSPLKKTVPAAGRPCRRNAPSCIHVETQTEMSAPLSLGTPPPRRALSVGCVTGDKGL